MSIKQLHIPDIGDRLELVQPWAFTVMHEHRNKSLEELAFDGHLIVEPYYRIARERPNFYGLVPRKQYHPMLPDNEQSIAAHERFNAAKEGPYNLRLAEGEAWFDYTLPAGTVLTVDRIYIRKGMKDFSSVSFFASIPGIKAAPRFWVKLKDANNVLYQPVAAKIDERPAPEVGDLITFGRHRWSIGIVGKDKERHPLDSEPAEGTIIKDCVNSQVDGKPRVKGTFKYSSKKHQRLVYPSVSLRKTIGDW